MILMEPFVNTIKTEDDTFKALSRIPLLEVRSIYSKWWYDNVPDTSLDNIEAKNEFLNRHGWSRDELIKGCMDLGIRLLDEASMK